MKRLIKLVNWNNRSLQVKLMSIFAFTLVFIIGVNVFMFVNVHTMVQRLEQIYVSNLNLDGLLSSLGDVQDSMKEYLDTKSTDSLEKYYRADQSYRGYLELLNTKPTDDKMLLAEKNIYNLSLSYLELVEDTVNAKRGRDVEQYSYYYEQAYDSVRVIETFIYSLNNARFKTNNNDYRALLTSMKYLEGINIAVLVLASILGVFLVSVVVSGITQPLRELSQAAKEVSDGHFDIEVEVKDSEDEIGILSAAFAQMLESIRSYVARIKVSIRKENAMKEKELMMESQMADARLKYLQAQINPHFLFNTLNAGAQLAMMEGAQKTTLFIENMASFFRYNISRLDEDTTIGEELELVDNYIYILNVRFSGEIHYHKNVDEDTTAIRVPSMILQPIVENAVNYGIRDVDHEKIIEVSCSSYDDYTEISVWDNGRGMEKSRIEEVLSDDYVPEKQPGGGNGIGIGNVISRLRLYYGKEGLLEIKSDGKDTGTEVLIKIPKNRGSFDSAPDDEDTVILTNEERKESENSESPDAVQDDEDTVILTNEVRKDHVTEENGE